METESSTPQADLDFAVEMRTASPTPLDDTMIADPATGTHSDLDHRLYSVSSQPSTRSELQNLDVIQRGVDTEEDAQIQRSNTLPSPAIDKEGDGSRLLGMRPMKSAQQINGSLHQALKDEDMYTFMCLLNAGADVNELGRHNRTPLHVCALLNDKFSTQALLRTGRADLSLRDIHDRTPLECTLEVGNDSLACLLLQQGAKIEDLARFIIEMTKRRSNPAEEKAAHTCIAWLSKQNDIYMEGRFIDALVTGSGSSAGSIARLLEGTPFREPYEMKSSIQTGSTGFD